MDSEEGGQTGTESKVYSQFLLQLDNSQLRQHIAEISQDASTQSSDPFNDGLDEVLLGIDTGLDPTSTVGCSKQGAELYASTDDDLSDHSDNSEHSGKSDNSVTLGEVGELHGFGDYSLYFANKHMKQQLADDIYVQWENQRKANAFPPLFKDCVIYVNGHTNPSINEIHRLVVLYGGKFLSFLSNKGSATHIICDRLTPRKNVEFRNYKVVKAKWLTDSIEHKKLLLWRDYRTITDLEYGQKRLDFPLVEEDIMKPALVKKLQSRVLEHEIEDDIHLNSSDEEITSDISVSSNIALPVKGLSNTTSEQEELVEFVISDIESEDSLEADRMEPDFDEFDDSNLDFDEKHGHEEPKTSNNTSAPKKQRQQKFDNSKGLDAKHPDFLKHFFERSRLHHLSTWKADLRLKVLRRILRSKKPSQKSYPTDKRLILHIDFDCFFVSASCLNHPELDINRDPIVVTHGGKSADIASCNYVTRKLGVRNGMWVEDAEKLCPNLVKLDYDFEGYEKYSNLFYGYLLENEEFDSVFPVLIDEVLVDASTMLQSVDQKPTFVNNLCSKIRNDVFQLTKCTVSIGASHNVLLAKMATKKIKPNGQFFLYKDINLLLMDVPLRELPGIGRLIEYKAQEMLKEFAITPKICHVLDYSQSKLISYFGQKTGEKIYNFARGIDDTNISKDLTNPESTLGRKSVSVDVNYGIRFDTMDQLDYFLMQIAQELYRRLVNLGMCGSTLNLRLAKRAPGAPVVTSKHLGLGKCEFINKTSRLGTPTSDWGILGAEMKVMYRMLNIPVQDLRGIAVTMTKLEDVDQLMKSKQATLQFNRPKKRKADQIDSKIQGVNDVDSSVQNELDDLDKIDWTVFDSLPLLMQREIRQEMTRRGVVDKRLKRQDSNAIKPKISNGKISLQYLLPTQAGSASKYIRVVEAPRKKKNYPVKSKVSNKRKREEFYEHSESYNQSVIDELPTQIREEVYKDVEYKKKVKHFDTDTLRDKLIRRQAMQVAKVESVSEDWIKVQGRRNRLPKFFGEYQSLKQIKQHIQEWVISSLDQEGPHEDDVSFFTEYLAELYRFRKYSVCVVLVQHLKKCLDHERSMMYSKPEQLLLVRAGLDSWDFVIKGKVVPSCEILVHSVT